MKIGIDMGHSLSGAGTGAVGFKKEVEMNRLAGNRLIQMLKEKGHTVVNCTTDYASTTNGQLSAIVNKANAQALDLFVSLHLNSYHDSTANGVETYIWNGSWADKENNRNVAKKVNDELASRIGWYNRGVKEANYYVLSATKSRAILIELGFCSNKADMDKWNTENIAKAIFKAITGTEYSATTSTPTPAPTPNTSSGCEKVILAPVTEVGGRGTFTVTEPSGIRFRDYYCTHCGKVQGVYEYKESVIYDKKCYTEKYTWISWIGGNNQRRWMPIKDRRTGESWGNVR